MFTDILDYSSLMQQDAPQVHIRKERHHQIFDSITKKYNGNVLQYYGGATLSIFQSAIDKHIRGGLLRKSEERLQLTEKGMDLANYVIVDFL